MPFVTIKGSFHLCGKSAAAVFMADSSREGRYRHVCATYCRLLGCAVQHSGPAEDLFHSAWVSLGNALSERHVSDRSWSRRDSQEAMLWAELSVGGRINASLAGTLDGNDLDALDKLTLPEKYALGPRVAIGKNLFPRDRDPWRTLEELRKVRNGLVHPRPVSVHVVSDDEHDSLYAKFNPVTAARIVLEVAAAACTQRLPRRSSFCCARRSRSARHPTSTYSICCTRRSTPNSGEGMREHAAKELGGAGQREHWRA
jgi:hypothetical protein